MKSWISFICHLGIITILTSFATFDTRNEFRQQVPESLIVDTSVCNEPVFLVSRNTVDTEENRALFLGNRYHGFKEALAFKESRGDYSVVNTLGYMGKYQFGKGTLQLMGVNDPQKFLEDPILQEKVFQLNVARNKWILRRDIKRFVGKRINGTVITESGIIASSHLAGAGNVKKYLRSYGQNDFSDAYGSTIAYYMKKFRGYDISSVMPQKNPKI
ncbi:MAG: hypothetical protein AAGB24_06635 [Bacteroidota bacterium]